MTSGISSAMISPTAAPVLGIAASIQSAAAKLAIIKLPKLKIPSVDLPDPEDPIIRVHWTASTPLSFSATGTPRVTPNILPASTVPTAAQALMPLGASKPVQALIPVAEFPPCLSDISDTLPSPSQALVPLATQPIAAFGDVDLSQYFMMPPASGKAAVNPAMQFQTAFFDYDPKLAQPFSDPFAEVSPVH